MDKVYGGGLPVNPKTCGKPDLFGSRQEEEERFIDEVAEMEEYLILPWG